MTASRLASGLLPAALLLLLAPAVQAQGIDLSRGGPIDITSQGGIEWLQNQHEVIALGDARAVRQNVTVTADRLIAYYRKKAGTTGQPVASAATSPPATSPPAATPAAASAGAPGISGDTDTSGNEIYRVEAEGHVQIFTATDHAQGDRAIYDLDQAVLVMTGHGLRLTTPNDVITARDDLEYWSQKHMAVARGDAVVVTKDARRIAADVLVAYTTPNAPAPSGQPVTRAAAKPGAPAAADDPLAASGKLEKVEAFGHVSLRTPTDIVTGDRGVYVPETGIALLVGNVHITRGQNQLAGARAAVNLKTGVSRLLAAGTDRVQGLIVPNDATSQGVSATPSPAAGRKP